MITPVLLAGGSGKRLWPLSRKAYPKQFCKFNAETTLFQSSAQRLTSSHTLEFAHHITLTNADYRFIIGDQLNEVGIDPGPILIEPEAKNTAAAILAATLFAYSHDANSVLLVAPSDHVIPNTDALHAAIKVGLSRIHDGKIVTFGIKPTHPETGYGYLELSEDSIDDNCSFDLKKFVEKPNLENAVQMLQAGRYLWNSGIFLFRAQVMIDVFGVYAPEILNLVSQAIDGSFQDLGFLRLASEPWSKLEDISIDFAIMEKAQNIVAVPYASKWSDLGGWDAVWSESEGDSSGNVTSISAHAINCSNSLLRSEDNNQQVVGIGLQDIMAIVTSDAVLIASKACAQDTKKAVELLKKQNIPQAESFSKKHRPWGWFECLAIGDCFQVKRLFVKAGAALSLQSHNYRSEHWVVVEGKAKVTIEHEIKILNEGQSVYVPLKAKHRIENTSGSFTVIIEVQIGKYLGEDDIVRYEDIYDRN